MSFNMRTAVISLAWAVTGILLAVSHASAGVTVTLTEPTNGSLYASDPSNITLSATASATQGYTLSKVEFFHGTTLIATTTASPYTYNWTNVPGGTYTLTAKATAIKKNSPNQTATSAASTVTVNTRPTVGVTGPTNNTVFAAPANITITATASDSDGTVAKVDFYQGTTLIGTATTAPSSFNWTNVAAGSYSLTAVATDNLGQTAASTAVSVTVDIPAAASITAPVNNTVFTAPANITIAATASDSDGTVARVDFYQGTTLIGTATAAPYSFNWTNVAAGSYSLTAVATDNQGVNTTSAVVAIIVNSGPNVTVSSPASGAIFTAPAAISVTATASDSDGTITKVDFYYQGSNLIATLGSAPYTFNWTNVPVGTYSLTAVATDNRGASTTSAAVSVTVNAPPAITLTSPANNAAFSAPANIFLVASAGDVGGDAIQKVEFFQGTSLIATVTSPPYSYNWQNVGIGSYVLTAKATDNFGATTTSSPVNITVSNASSAGLYFVYTDHLNTPRQIINSQGQAVWTWDNGDPFGNNPPNENPSGLGAFTCNLRFPGQYFDKETNLHYNYFRDYDPAIGRYIQSDPIGLVGGINTYSYVRSNPLSFIDPTGLTLEDMNFIYQQVKSQFPEVESAGKIDFMGPILNWLYRENPVDGTTGFLTGTIYLPSRYAAKECLSFSDWEHVFFRSIFHESMHSTDWFFQRPSSAREELIINRVDAEARGRSLPPSNKPTWGTPRRERVDMNALYREYRAKSPDCTCTQ